jgi:threonine dehydrogenase-like Zn-dependent dehydrogenase
LSARELTDGFGVHFVLECVGLEQSTLTAIAIARPGGSVGRVGVPQDETIPAALPAFYNNVTVGGGPAPARAYIDELLPDILEDRIEPGPAAQPTRTEPPEERTAETTGATGNKRSMPQAGEGHDAGEG